MDATRPSATALAVAAGLALLARDPRVGSLIPRDAGDLSRRFVDACGTTLVRAALALPGPWARRGAAIAERLLAPGVMLHHVLRKRFIEGEVRRALRDGVPQMVILGAGFDSLGVRLARERSRAVIIEVDHPATQRAKRRALAGAERAPVFVEADLARVPVDDALAPCPRFNPLMPSLFLAEGLLMYLPPDRVADLLRRARGPGNSGRRILFTFMEPRSDGAIDFRESGPLLRWWMHRRREPFTWGIPRDALRPWLADLGWSLEFVADSRDLRLLAPRETRDAPLAEGECIALARAL